MKKQTESITSQRQDRGASKKIRPEKKKKGKEKCERDMRRHIHFRGEEIAKRSRGDHRKGLKKVLLSEKRSKKCVRSTGRKEVHQEPKSTQPQWKSGNSEFVMEPKKKPMIGGERTQKELLLVLSIKENAYWSKSQPTEPGT